jgi:hypothetical protein
MFTVDATIDAVQKSKKQFVSMFVNNENMAKALNEFIDAQTEYTKDAVKAGTDTATVLGQEMVRSFGEFTKVDLYKMSDAAINSVKYMADMQKSWLNSFKA